MNPIDVLWGGTLSVTMCLFNHLSQTSSPHLWARPELRAQDKAVPWAGTDHPNGATCKDELHITHNPSLRRILSIYYEM